MRQLGFRDRRETMIVEGNKISERVLDEWKVLFGFLGLAFLLLKTNQPG